MKPHFSPDRKAMLVLPLLRKVQVHEFVGPLRDLFKDEVRGANRVVYDISGKPPATIEWE